MQQRSVLMISGQADMYGAARSLRTLASGLQTRGWRVVVVVPEHGPLVDALSADGVATVFADAGVMRRVLPPREWARFAAVDMPASIWNIQRLARAHDLVHVNTSVEVGALIGGALAGRPVVCHLRESYAEHAREFRALAWLLRRTCRRVIAVSTDIAREAEVAGLGDRTVVIHNSWDRLPDRSDAHHQKATVVQVGRINDWKGQLVLVDALALLRDRGVIVPATIVGDVYPGGERYRQALEERISTRDLQDQVRLTGHVDNPQRFMAPDGVFVQPSTRPEPFGLALIEGMLAGMASVASDAGGPRDIIRDGQTGLLVAPGDANALAAAIERLWQDPDMRAQLGAAAADDVRVRFSPEREVDRCDALFREVLGS